MLSSFHEDLKGVATLFLFITKFRNARNSSTRRHGPRGNQHEVPSPSDLCAYVVGAVGVME